MTTKVGGSGGATDNVPQTTSQPYQIPDWLSPARLIALSAPQARSVVCPAGVSTILAQPSARRVGLIVICPNASAAGFTLSPGTPLGADGIATALGSNVFVVSLSDWLSVTCGVWYGFSPGDVTVRVIDLVRT